VCDAMTFTKNRDQLSVGEVAASSSPALLFGEDQLLRESSNLAPSIDESIANLTSGAHDTAVVLPSTLPAIRPCADPRPLGCSLPAASVARGTGCENGGRRPVEPTTIREMAKWMAETARPL
jgi:hypothetical protein